MTRVKVQTVYMPVLYSENSDTNLPCIQLVTETYKLAHDYIENQVWLDTHDTWDTWDVISESTDNFVRLQNRKTGEIIKWQVEIISLLKK